MIDLFLRAVDRLLELLKIQGKRFKFRYDEIYKPAFAELQLVHTDYLEMFNAVLALLEGRTTPSAAACLRAAIELLAARRIPQAAVRKKLLALDQTLQDERSRGLLPVEQEFLKRVSVYFHGAANAIHTQEKRSVATCLLMELQQAEYMNIPIDTVLEECRVVISRVEEQWPLAVTSFNALQFELARHSS